MSKNPFARARPAAAPAPPGSSSSHGSSRGSADHDHMIPGTRPAGLPSQAQRAEGMPRGPDSNPFSSAPRPNGAPGPNGSYGPNGAPGPNGGFSLGGGAPPVPKRAMSIQSSATLENLASFVAEYDALRHAVDGIEQAWRSGELTATQSRDQLAQVEARVNKLQCQGLDSMELICPRNFIVIYPPLITRGDKIYIPDENPSVGSCGEGGMDSADESAAMFSVIGDDIMGVMWGGIKWGGDKIPSP